MPDAALDMYMAAALWPLHGSPVPASMACSSAPSLAVIHVWPLQSSGRWQELTRQRITGKSSLAQKHENKNICVRGRSVQEAEDTILDVGCR